jgi:Skp family chaperone for outer membrane proteins
MKTKLFILLFLLFLNNSNASEGVYFIDVDYIFKNSNYGKKIIIKLEEQNQKNISELKIKETELKDLESQISKQKNIISKDELNKKVENLKIKISSYKIEKENKIEDFKKLKSNELNNFFKEITPLLEEFMKINSIKILLDRKNIFIADSNYDITIKILEYLNKNR